MSKTSKQPFLFLLHGWLSLPIWIFFCLICLTGTIAVFSHELTWLTNPTARANNPQHLPAKPLTELVQAVQHAEPTADIQHAYVLEPYLITAIQYSTATQPMVLAYVNPYTATIQAQETGITFIYFMRSLHGWLLAPWQAANGGYYSWGYYGVSILSVLILGAVITGLIIYKKFWRAVTRPRIRWRSNSRTLLGDLHRHSGVWSLWFLLVISLTALFYLVQAVFWHVGEGDQLHPHPEAIVASSVPLIKTGEPIPKMISFMQAEQAAQQALTNVRWSAIAMPEHSRDYYQFSGQGDGVFYDDYAYKVYINPWTGQVAAVQTPDNMSLLQAISHIVDPLHYGTLAGWITKLIWFIFGVLLTALSIMGFLIWWQRTQKEVGQLWPTWSIRQRVWFRSKYLINGCLLILPVWFLYQALNPVFPAAWPIQKIGTIEATPTPADNNPPYQGKYGLLKDFSVTVCATCSEQIRIAWMNIGTKPLANAPNEYGILHGSRYGLHVHVPYTAPVTANNKLWLTIQHWDGTFSQQSWPLTP